MTILDTLTNLLKKSIDGDPPPPAILLNIGSRLNELTAVSVDPSGSGIDRWLSTLRSITHDTPTHETLVVRMLQMHFPRLAEALTLLNIICIPEWEGAPPVPHHFSINWPGLHDLLNKPGESGLALLFNKVQKIEDIKSMQALILLLISSPQPLLKLEYAKQGFGSLPNPGDPGIDLLALINMINSPLSLPLPFSLPLTLDEFKATAGPAAADGLGALVLDGPAEADFNGLNDLALELHLNNPQTTAQKVVDLGGGWKLGMTGSATVPSVYRLKFNANALDPGAPSSGDFTVFLTRQPDGDTALLLGELNGTHFAIQSIRVGFGFHSAAPLFDLVTQMQGIQFVLKPDFLSFLSFGLDLPALLKFTSDVEIRYIQGKGLSVGGSAGDMPGIGVEFAAPLNLRIGSDGTGLNVDQVVTRLEIALQGSLLRFRVSFRYGARAQFGPLAAVMDGAGVWFGRWTDGTGGLLPPQAIGLTLDAGPVSGGGALKFVSDKEFAGGLQLKILGIGAFAYGLYQSLPNGDPSFVALIGVRLPLPGVQLSFGFAISGFGGLVGMNRRADTDRLRERLTSGGAGDVLFNDNPMQNAPRLLGDMQQFFPPAGGIFIAGPTLQINWLYILKLDVGVFIQIPGPVFIAGSARLVIGSEEFALVYLRMDFIGGVDPAKSLIFFDAGLVNSQVLGIFRITGGVALRIAYGDNGYFLFTVGGFHPSFNPNGMELPRVARVGTSVSLGPVWLKQEMYLAITSNTFQLGTRVEAGLDIGPISAHGWFAFDALIQFKPFHFIAQIDAGMDVEVEGVSLCSVHVEGKLSGPGPLVLEARASVKLLFVRISGHITITLNDAPPEQIAPIDNLPDYLRKELTSPDNLRVDGEDPCVIFGPHTADTPLFAPVGALVWEQKRVPLNLAIEKAEGVALEGSHTLTVTSGLPGETSEEDWFGTGTFLNLPDSVALNAPRFAKQQSGLRLSASVLTPGPTAPGNLELELVKLPRPSPIAMILPSALYMSGALTGMLRERSSAAALDPGPARVKVVQEAWNAHGPDGKPQNAATLNSVQALTHAMRTGGAALPAVEKPLDLSGVL